MITDFALFAIFLGAASSAFVIIRRKIPLLLQVPQQLIEESFVTRPSRLKKFLGPVEEFFREQRYRTLYRAALLWVLHRMRLRLLRLERVVFRLLERLEAQNPRVSEADARYWNELKQWKHEGRENGNSIPRAVFNPEAPPMAKSKRSPGNKSSG